MKILLIGYYDYSYYAGACVLDNNEIKDIELTEEQLATINHYRDWGNDSEEYKKIEEEIFSQYDMVILCEDGSFELLKGTNQEFLKMNKELQALERIINPRITYFCGRMSGKTEMARKEFEQRQKDIECVISALKENEKLKKMIELIKEKVAPLVNLDITDIGDGSNKLRYRIYDSELFAYTNLTQEEYNLLKEILK